MNRKRRAVALCVLLLLLASLLASSASAARKRVPASAARHTPDAADAHAAQPPPHTPHTPHTRTLTRAQLLSDARRSPVEHAVSAADVLGWHAYAADDTASASDARADGASLRAAALAFITPWNAHGYERTLRYAARGALTHVSPCWLRVSAAFDVEGADSANTTWLADMRARAPRTLVVPRVSMEAVRRDEYMVLLGAGADGVDGAIRAVQRIGDGLARAVETLGVDGVVIDFHGIPIAGIGNLPVRMAGALRGAHEAYRPSAPHTHVGITLPPVRSEHIHGAAESSFVHAIDLFVVMAYDFGGGGNANGGAGGANPVAPLPWVEESVERTLSSLDDAGQRDPRVAARVLIGMNWYGYAHCSHSSAPEPLLAGRWEQILEAEAVPASASAASSAGGARGAARRRGVSGIDDWDAGDDVHDHGKGVEGAASAPTTPTAEQLAALQLTWDAAAAEHVLRTRARSKRASETTHHPGMCEVRYPTLQSLQVRLDLAERLGCGVAVWEFGQGVDAFAELMVPAEHAGDRAE